MKKSHLIFSTALALSGCNAQQSANLDNSAFSLEADQDMVNTASDSAAGSSEDVNDDGLSTASVEVDAAANARGLFKRLRKADCPTVSKADVDANTIKVTFTFDNCTTGGILHPARSLTFNGTTVRTIAKETGDDGVTIKRDVTVDRQLAIDGMFGQHLDIDAQNKFTHVGSYPNVSSTVVLDVNRKRSTKNKTLREYEVSGTLDYVSSGTTDIEQVVANGETKVEHKLSNRTVDYTFADVTWKASCEQPLSGTITKKVTLADGTSSASTLTFDGTCGSVKDSANGSVALPEPENDE